MSPYGIAVDLGTSKISMALYEIESENALGKIRFLNPQSTAGEDVVSRIKYAVSSSKKKQELVDALREIVCKQVVSLLDTHEIDTNESIELVIVGNTPMHHFFFDLELNDLLEPPFLTKNRDSINVSIDDIYPSISLDGTIYSPPLVGSFIGNDLIASSLVAFSVCDNYPMIVIDVGTNTEILVSNGSKHWAVSAASGPAFEGMSIQSGMSAERGAIHSVDIDIESLKAVVRTIGDEPPKGFCGSGVVSALAAMFKSGIINRNGSIERRISNRWIHSSDGLLSYVVVPHTESGTSNTIQITQPEIRMLQQSKASIRAAIETLFTSASINHNEILCAYITGAFGSELVIDDAFAIGLFPDVSKGAIIQENNGALSGAIKMLHSSGRKMAEDLAQETKYVDLMESDAYSNFHVKAQFFGSDFFSK